MDKLLIKSTLIGSFGGLIFGYDLGGLSVSTQTIRDKFHLSPSLFGLTVSFSLWGTICGSLLAGRFADKVGQRELIASASLVYALGALGMTLPISGDWSFFLAMRFLCGMAIGGFTVVCPLYLSEIAPIALRGRLVSMFQIQVGGGVLIAFLVGSILSHLKTVDVLWRWCLGGGALPAVLLLFLISYLPQKERRNPSTEGVPRREKMIAYPSLPRIYEGPAKLFRRENMRLILLATSIAIFNQLSGVNILLLYMLDILSSAGIGLSIGHTYTVLISCLGLVTTLLGMSFVDKVGRKPLLFVGSIGMALCLLSLGLAIPHHLDPSLYLLIFVTYNAFFAFSQGTVVWVYLSELFPPGIRGAGQGYGSSVHWIANAILISIFPLMQRLSSVRTFYFFASMMIVQVIVILLWYPETRGTPLGSSRLQKRGIE